MAQKKPVTFRVNAALAERFEESTRLFLGKQGLCLAAAMLLFLQCHPEEQGEFVKRAFDLDVDADVDQVLEALKVEQQRRIQAGETGKRGERPRSRKHG